MSIKTYTKGTRIRLSENFVSTEFDCHGKGCCSTTLNDDELDNILQKIRTHFGDKCNVHSGYRCPTHNKNVGGASQSYHTKGQAADIDVTGVEHIEVAKYAESIGVLGIGLYDWGVHVDTRTTKFFWKGANETPVITFGGTPIKEETEKENTPSIIEAAYKTKAKEELNKAKEAIEKALTYLK